MAYLNRRAFLVTGLQLPIVLAFATEAVAECVDPDELSDAVRGMRESLEYVDSAADQARACRACTFFKSHAGNASCGHCEVLGGLVSVKGHCDSWTARR